MRRNNSGLLWLFPYCSGLLSGVPRFGGSRAALGAGKAVDKSGEANTREQRMLRVPPLQSANRRGK